MYRAVAWAAARQAPCRGTTSEAVAEVARACSWRSTGSTRAARWRRRHQAIREPGSHRQHAFCRGQSARARALGRASTPTGAGTHVVTEGRDQGTVAFPAAECKFFLTASAQERARRRLGATPRRTVKMSARATCWPNRINVMRGTRSRECGPLCRQRTPSSSIPTDWHCERSRRQARTTGAATVDCSVTGMITTAVEDRRLSILQDVVLADRQGLLCFSLERTRTLSARHRCTDLLESPELLRPGAGRHLLPATNQLPGAQHVV